MFLCLVSQLNDGLVDGYVHKFDFVTSLDYLLFEFLTLTKFLIVRSIFVAIESLSKA